MEYSSDDSVVGQSARTSLWSECARTVVNIGHSGTATASPHRVTAAVSDGSTNKGDGANRLTRPAGRPDGAGHVAVVEQAVKGEQTHFDQYRYV